MRNRKYEIRFDKKFAEEYINGLFSKENWRRWTDEHNYCCAYGVSFFDAILVEKHKEYVESFLMQETNIAEFKFLTECLSFAYAFALSDLRNEIGNESKIRTVENV